MIIARFGYLGRVMKQSFCLRGKDILNRMFRVESLRKVRLIIVMLLSFLFLFGLGKGDEMGVFGDRDMSDQHFITIITPRRIPINRHTINSYEKHIVFE